jgi:tetratricopeptide (TPR) repeat protein
MKKSFRAAALIGLTLPVGILACFNVDGVSVAGLHKANPSLAPAERLRAVMLVKTPVAYVTDASGTTFAVVERSTAPALGGADPMYAKISAAEQMAVKRVLLGNYEKGIEELEKLEKDAPGRYSIAANLGTAYELSGDNRKALQWISEGIRRNPASHEGTEWLHALILEAKLQLEKNPAWLRDHHVIGLDAARVKDPAYRLQAGARSLSVAEVEKALDYQLLERMLLVKPKDAVVADLLYTYALIESGEGNRDSALDLLGLSREYGSAVPSLLDELTKQLKTR